MKTIKFLILAVFFASCSTTYDDSMAINDLHLHPKTSEAIIKHLELILSEDNKKMKYDNYELREMKGSYYFIAENDEIVSTTLLKRGQGKKQDQLVSSGITCTSARCASSYGCIPKEDPTGKYCSLCQFGSGDCKKTIVDLEPAPEP